MNKIEINRVPELYGELDLHAKTSHTMFSRAVTKSRSLLHLQCFRFFSALPIQKELEEFIAVCRERGCLVYLSQNGTVVTVKTAQREQPLHIELIPSHAVLPTILQELRELRRVVQAQEARSQAQELNIKVLRVDQKCSGR